MLKIGQGIFENEQIIIIHKESFIELRQSEEIKSTLDLVKAPGKNLIEKTEQFLLSSRLVLKIDEESAIEELNFQWLPCIDAPEIWGVGVNNKDQAWENDNDLNVSADLNMNLYAFVYHSERPEIFFKGFSRTSKGHNQELLLRSDSKQVLPEAELILVLNDNKIIGFTYGNDLTAWDIEKESPLYLSQAKIWDGSCGIAPYIIPIECVAPPYIFNFYCRVIRNGKLIINSYGSTLDLKRSYAEIIHYLYWNNKVPSGTLLFTGTACVISRDFNLQDGDIVEIEKMGYGTLKNYIKSHPSPSTFKE